MGGVLNPPICPYCIQLAPFLLVTPRCLYTSPGGESKQSHVFSRYLKILWGGKKKDREDAVKGQLDYTSKLGYGLAWKRGGAKSTYTTGNNYLISTHAHSDQPSPAPPS